MNKIIMVVDDSATNLAVAKGALQDSYDVIAVSSGEMALGALKKIEPHLILLDIEMPGMNGYKTLHRIKKNKERAHIPVIFLTGKSDLESEFVGLSLGAVDYISKPFSAPLLIKRIEVHLLMEEQKKHLQNYNDNLKKMVDKKTKKIIKLQDVILSAIAELVEYRDGTTGGHIERTQMYLKILVDKMVERGVYMYERESWDLKLLIRSALLHDVGKVSISDAILNKPGKLTAEEYEIMKTHTTLGKEVIDRISKKVEENEFLQHAAVLAYSHHERWDGKGYPLGLKGEEIPLQGRLMSIADVYDALVSVRPYKPAFSREKAERIILDGEGTQFDPILTQIFADTKDEFHYIAKSIIQ